MGLRERLESNRPLVAVVVILAAFSLLILYSSLSGPGAVQWTGDRVQGVERGGIVYYSYAGQKYSIDDAGRFNSTTVAFDPSDPNDTAILVNPLEAGIEVAGVVMPYPIAAGIIGVTWYRRRQRRAEFLDGDHDGFGRGLDPEVVQRLIEKRRQGW